MKNVGGKLVFHNIMTETMTCSLAVIRGSSQTENRTKTVGLGPTTFHVPTVAVESAWIDPISISFNRIL